MLPQATVELYRAQQARVARTLLLTRGAWDSAGSVAALEGLVPRLTLLLAASMLGAARDGAGSVGAALEETGFGVDPVARVVPEEFARSASDGRPLGSLLMVPVVMARSVGLESGRVVLDRIVHTQVGDAARAASQVGITVRPGVGWVRMVNPPSCQDCAVLAGKWFRFNQGFERHKNCDCVHRVAHEAEPPEGYADYVPVDQVTDLTEAQRQAIKDGADFNRVINAYRRSSPAARSKMTTTTELGRRGGRLTPDGIYERVSSREQALDLLRQYGYVQ